MFDNIMFDEEILFTYIGYAAGLATILTFCHSDFADYRNQKRYQPVQLHVHHLQSGAGLLVCLRRLYRFLYPSLFKSDYVFLYIYHSYPHHIL